MKKLLKNCHFILEQIKKKIKANENNSRSISPNTKTLQKEKNLKVFSMEKNEKDEKIEILLDIIKKKDYEIEKLQRLLRSKTQYIQSIEVFSWKFK